MKRLLLVCYYFPPAAGGGVARALSFARYLPRFGWQVTVLCADPQSAPLSDSSRDLKLPPSVDVVRVPMPAGLARGRRSVIGSGGGRPSGLYRAARAAASWVWVPDSFVAWERGAAARARELLARDSYAAVLTTSPPDSVHLVGLRLRRSSSIPWIVDFRDPWVGLAYKRPPTPLHAWRQRQLRDRVLEGADLVLATTRASAALLGKTAPAGARIEVLPNGWDPDLVSAPVTNGGDPGRRLRLVYTGTLWDVPATRTFLAALARALSTQSSRDIEVELIGPHESAEERLVRWLELTDVVHFRGQVPYADSRARQATADVLLLLQVHGPGYEVAIPGKLYEYLASSRPILAFLPSGEAADLVTRAGGWVVAPEDEPGAERTIRRLLAGERPASDSPERREIVDQHRRDRIAGQLAVLLDETVARTASE